MPNAVDPRVFQLPVYLEARANRLRNLFYYVDPHSLRGKRVLEAGCGTGELGEEFVKLGCRVVSIDATAEYIQELKTKYPAREAYVVDLDAFDPTPLGAFDPTPLGAFDIILCFGLLYHLWKPTRFLSVCASIAEEIYLDTMMCDSEEITYYLMREQGADQAFFERGLPPYRRLGPAGDESSWIRGPGHFLGVGELGGRLPGGVRLGSAERSISEAWRGLSAPHVHLLPHSAPATGNFLST